MLRIKETNLNMAHNEWPDSTYLTCTMSAISACNCYSIRPYQFNFTLVG